MRITNKIMQRNNLSNINTNKIYQDRLSNQMSTEKKINRPSDDPVVAIRALRLRSSVTEVTQYYSKNIPDAKSWLSVTEDALHNLTEVITDMIYQCTKGSEGDLTTEDRQIILEQLKALADEVYKTGDADYAGRYVFTGYRTNTSLSFLQETNLKYTITEQLGKDFIDSVTFVDMGDLLDINDSNFDSTALSGINETQIDAMEIHRIRLAYNDCDPDSVPTIEYTDPNTGNTVTLTATTIHSYGDPDAVPDPISDPYTYVAENDDAVVYVPETGEILLGKDAYEALMSVKDNESTAGVDEGEIRVTYEKTHWNKGDLRPEHYFYCVADDGSADGLVYNKSYLDGNAERQDIEYDVGFNQTIRVNSTADECFQHGVGREADDIVSAMQDVLNLENIKATLDKLQKEYEGIEPQAGVIKNQMDAVEKALTYAKDKEQKLFESGITAFQKYLDDANLCITNCGTRSSKLSLIETRMQNQKTTFETLKSENEDIDITEVAIYLSSAELTYEAALMATGKIMQTTLLNFI